MSTWDFKLNYAGGGEILKENQKLKSLQEEIAQKQMSLAQAQFLSDFGTEGNFKLEFSQGKTRMSYRVVAADAKTGAILKANPKWLAKVTSGVTL